MYNMSQPVVSNARNDSHVVIPVVFANGFVPVVGEAVSLNPHWNGTGNYEITEFSKGIFFGFLQENLGHYGSVFTETLRAPVQLDEDAEPKVGDLLYVNNANKASTEVGFPISGYFASPATTSLMPDGTAVRSAMINLGSGRSLQEVPHIKPTAQAVAPQSTPKKEAK